MAIPTTTGFKLTFQGNLVLPSYLSDNLSSDQPFTGFESPVIVSLLDRYGRYVDVFTSPTVTFSPTSQTSGSFTVFVPSVAPPNNNVTATNPPINIMGTYSVNTNTNKITINEQLPVYDYGVGGLPGAGSNFNSVFPISVTLGSGLYYTQRQISGVFPAGGPTYIFTDLNIVGVPVLPPTPATPENPTMEPEPIPPSSNPITMEQMMAEMIPSPDTPVDDTGGTDVLIPVQSMSDAPPAINPTPTPPEDVLIPVRTSSNPVRTNIQDFAVSAGSASTVTLAYSYVVGTLSDPLRRPPPVVYP